MSDNHCSLDLIFPNELLLEIFQYVDTFDLYRAFDNLNHRINCILNDVPLKLDLSTVRDEKHIQHLYKHFIQPKRYQFVSLKIPKHQKCPSLTSLNIDQFSNLSRLNIYNPSIKQLSQIQPLTFPCLKSLSIPFISYQSNAYHQLCNRIFIKNAFKLLNKCYLSDLTYQVIDSLTTCLYSSSIEYLKIRWCTKQTFSLLIQNLLKLNTLCVNIYPCHDQTFLTLTTNVLTLIRLKLNIVNGNMSFKQIKYLLEYLPNLEHLTLISSINIYFDLNEWKSIAIQSISNLKTLNIVMIMNNDHEYNDSEQQYFLFERINCYFNIVNRNGYEDN
ncbi:unnamed protein product [Didymodactylos carnosus]|uniref:F-box domain-containing protein n=1 Tax=Didymodactylos carnosus TaxID=1234261 RepID=A0A8S2HJA4_9BILA|nr:unnamed protein product [Didymodactylos carnosus]CAF3648185.1 unnamed protein product [Didymodactylos carnosus]